MKQKRKHQAAPTIVAALSILGASLGVAAATPSQQGEVDAARSRGLGVKVAVEKTRIRSNQLKWRHPGSRKNVKPGETNTLSPQPLPPGARGAPSQ